MPLKSGRYRGPLFRALNPVYAREPLSGRGAELYGGRFNPVGTPALYTSLSASTALREANQVGSLQPTTLVEYRADLLPVLDTREPGMLNGIGFTPETLAYPGWRTAMLSGHRAPTQELALLLIQQGFCGLLVRSFAAGAGSDDLNIVIWQWSGDGLKLEVIDDEDRLRRI